MSQLPVVLTSAWKVSLEEELMRDPKLKLNDIEEMVQWCARQVYLPPVSKHTAALFLKLSDYDSKKAQVFIDNHYSFRTYYTSIFSERDPQGKDVKKAMNGINCFILPGQTDNGLRVLFASLKSPPDSSRFNASSNVKLVYMTLERDLLEHGFGDIDGYSVLFDARGFGLGHLTSITISLLKQLASYFLEGANMSIKEINIINVNPVVDKLLQMIRAVTPRELHERIKLFTKNKTDVCLAKYPIEILPNELGGNSELLLEEMTKSNESELNVLRPWFLADEAHLRVDEYKRPRDQQNKKVVKLQATLQKLELD